MDLEGYAQALVNNSPLDEVVIESADALTYQGQESLRLVYSGDSDNGARMRYLSYVFLRDGYAFQVSAGGKVGDVKDRDLEPFARAVELLEGPVQGPQDLNEPLKDAQGLTWHIKEGRFESLKGGLRLTPPQGWRLATGEAARALTPIATVALSRAPTPQRPQDPELSLVLSARPCHAEPSVCVEAAERALIGAFELSPRQEGTLEWSLLGASATFKLFDRPTTPFSYALHSVARDGVVIQALAWTLSKDLPHAWGPLPQALGAVELMSTQERASLRASLSATLRSDEGAITRGDTLNAHASWLRSVYRDSAYQATWRQPAGFWRARPEGGAQTSLHALSFEAPLYGLSGQLRLTRRGGGLMEAHEEALSALKRDLGVASAKAPTHKAQLREVSSLVSELEVASETEGAPATRYRLHTALKGGVAAYMITWREALVEVDAVIAQVEAGLTLGVQEPPLKLTQSCKSTQGERCEATLTFAPLRFALKGLPTGGDLTLYPSAGLGEASLSLTYALPDALVGVVAVGHARTESLEPLALAAAQRLAPSLGASPLTPKRLWVEGREARALTWQSAEGEVALYLLKRAPLVYGYLVIAPKGHALHQQGASPLSLME